MALDSKSRRGVLWNPLTTEYLNDLDFADDIVLLSTRQTDMQAKLNDLSSRSKAAGLRINIAKTKSLAVNATAPNLRVEGQTIENVSAFQYLGIKITLDGGARFDIHTRIRKTGRAFASLRDPISACGVN